MSYYPEWFDSAKWLLGVSGVILAYALRYRKSLRRHRALKPLAALLLAGAFAFGGTSGVLFNTHAAHVTTNGIVGEVNIHSGRSSSTHFSLTTPTGGHLYLGLTGAHHEIAFGETVEVTYQADSYSVLDISSPSGAQGGYQIHQNDNIVGSWFALVVAAGLALFGIFSWFMSGPSSGTN